MWLTPAGNGGTRFCSQQLRDRLERVKPTIRLIMPTIPSSWRSKKGYREFVQARYPQLQASSQEGSDREYYLKAGGLPPGIRFKHAFFRGEVSLIFEKAWVPTAQRHLHGNLPEGAWTVQHDSELHVRMPVEVMDPLRQFEEQEEIAAKALDQIGAMIPLALAVADARRA